MGAGQEPGQVGGAGPGSHSDPAPSKVIEGNRTDHSADGVSTRSETPAPGILFGLHLRAAQSQAAA